MALQLPGTMFHFLFPVPGPLRAQGVPLGLSCLHPLRKGGEEVWAGTLARWWEAGSASHQNSPNIRRRFRYSGHKKALTFSYKHSFHPSSPRPVNRPGKHDSLHLERFH